MKRVFAGTFMAAAFAVGLAAQATTPQSQPPMQEAKDAGKNVTVTGCLKAGDTADSFTLSDLKWKDDKAVGTSGSAAPAISATSIMRSSIARRSRPRMRGAAMSSSTATAS